MDKIFKNFFKNTSRYLIIIKFKPILSPHGKIFLVVKNNV